MFSVYILFSEKDQGWYIGYTSLRPEQRMQWHNDGRVKSTKMRRTFKLAYFETYKTKEEAIKREWHLKHPAGFLEKKRITTWLMEKQNEWPFKKNL